MNCSSEKLLENSFLHQKFRSPPPKPPRRRLSEQLVSDKPAAGELKHGDGYHLQSIDSHKNASLPANWTTDFGHLIAEKCFLSTSPYNSSRYQKKSLFDKFPLESQCERNVLNVENTNDLHKNANEYPCFPQPQKKEMALLRTPLRNCTENMKKQLSSIVQKNKNGVLNFNPHHSKSHYRHHSDPLLPCFSQELKHDSDTFDCHKSFVVRQQNELQNETNTQSNACLACKEINCLLEETRILKEINDKLWQNLISVQSTLENIQNVSSCTSGKTPFAEFLSEFYYAQKAKECAMEERLKVVIEDRNSAFLEIDHMVEAVVGLRCEESVESDGLENSLQSAGKCSDKDLQEIMQEIETVDNPITLLRKQKQLLSHIYRSKEAKNDFLSNELRLVLKERDNLQEKVKSLEMELKDLKQCNDLRHMDQKHWEDSLLEMFCYVVQQRNFILSKMDSIQNTGIVCQRPFKIQKLISTENYSSSEHVSLSQGGSMVPKSNISSHPNICVQNCDIFLKNPKILKDEVTLLTNALDIEIHKNEKIEAKCQRLERLVHVLQKKIACKSSGIFV
ncbi:uncharacterized protein LOC129218431 [Uloborus diversus]|uniref:uncharacterized protein LOC129218431 n=1 Tax=Uloborus diversus TaxID=327109 RepID=UPI002409DFC6|nr:uncharacterized protein LOC129218431 [Uloborus diversus]